jgi:hypothetical protein
MGGGVGICFRQVNKHILHPLFFANHDSGKYVNAEIEDVLRYDQRLNSNMPGFM